MLITLLLLVVWLCVCLFKCLLPYYLITVSGSTTSSNGSCTRHSVSGSSISDSDKTSPVSILVCQVNVLKAKYVNAWMIISKSMVPKQPSSGVSEKVNLQKVYLCI